MSHELHYTSVPRGLKSGSVGFSTVAQTAGLPAPIADRLEGLSGYRPVYPPGSPSVGLNPAVVSHLKIAIGGHSFDVLSRIAFAGLDYSERGNNYAHHVAIEAHERPAAGPAWLASQARFLDAAWSGEPRVLPAGRAVPQGDRAPAVCRAWAERFGDAGWAGVLAEAFLEDPKRPAYLVFEPGQDMLPLMVEALALIPLARRWDVTFSTYFTGQAQGLICLWRGVLRDSPEHAQARRLPNSLILDPNTVATASGAALVDQARTGIAPATAKKPTNRPSTSIGTVTPPKSRSTRAPGRPQPMFDDLDIDLEPEPPRRSSPASPSRKPSPTPSTPPVPRRKRQTPEERRSQMFMRVWIGFAGLLVFGLVGSMGWMVLGPKHTPVVADDPLSVDLHKGLAQGPEPLPPATAGPVTAKTNSKDGPDYRHTTDTPTPNLPGEVPALVQAAEVPTQVRPADPLRPDQRKDKQAPLKPDKPNMPIAPNMPSASVASIDPLPEKPKNPLTAKGDDPAKSARSGAGKQSLLVKSWGPLPEPKAVEGRNLPQSKVDAGRKVKQIVLLGWENKTLPTALKVEVNHSDRSKPPIIVRYNPYGVEESEELGKFAFEGNFVTFDLSEKTHTDTIPARTALDSLKRCLLVVEFAESNAESIGFLFENLRPTGPIKLKDAPDCLKKAGFTTAIFPKGRQPSLPVFESCEVRLAGGGKLNNGVPIKLVNEDKRELSRAEGVYVNVEGNEVKFALIIDHSAGLHFKFLPSPDKEWWTKNMPKTPEEIDIVKKSTKEAKDELENISKLRKKNEATPDQLQRFDILDDTVKRGGQLLAALEFRENCEIACVLTMKFEGRTLRIPLN